MKDTLKVGLVPEFERPRLIEIESDGNGSFLHALQELVGGSIEHFEPVWGVQPSLIVNEEGLYRCSPNRAIYATKQMAEDGYLSCIDYDHVVEEGELYTLLFGPIVAMSYDFNEEGLLYARDIADEEFDRLCETFEDPMSGLKAFFAMRHMDEEPVGA